MKKNEIKVLFSIFSICLFFVGLGVGSMADMFMKEYKNKIAEDNQNFAFNFNELCGDKDILQTSKCVRNFVSNNFNYYSTDEGEAMRRDYMDVYYKGGDCLDYSLLYSQLIRLLNDYESEIIMSLEDEHAFVKIHHLFDDGSYCYLDLMKEPDCYLTNLTPVIGIRKITIRGEKYERG